LEEKPMIADLYLPYRIPRPRPWRRRQRRLLAALVVVAALLVLLANAVYGGDGHGFEQVQVRPGDTLWTIAAARYGGSSDLRSRIDDIVSANQLNGGALTPGQSLVLPPP
jgi:nucleoid-associated protein YgaU